MQRHSIFDDQGLSTWTHLAEDPNSDAGNAREEPAAAPGGADADKSPLCIDFDVLRTLWKLDADDDSGSETEDDVKGGAASLGCETSSYHTMPEVPFVAVPKLPGGGAGEVPRTAQALPQAQPLPIRSAQPTAAAGTSVIRQQPRPGDSRMSTAVPVGFSSNGAPTAWVFSPTNVRPGGATPVSTPPTSASLPSLPPPPQYSVAVAASHPPPNYPAMNTSPPPPPPTSAHQPLPARTPSYGSTPPMAPAGGAYMLDSRGATPIELNGGRGCATSGAATGIAPNLPWAQLPPPPPPPPAPQTPPQRLPRGAGAAGFGPTSVVMPPPLSVAPPPPPPPPPATPPPPPFAFPLTTTAAAAANNAESAQTACLKDLIMVLQRQLQQQQQTQQQTQAPQQRQTQQQLPPPPFPGSAGSMLDGSSGRADGAPTNVPHAPWEMQAALAGMQAGRYGAAPAMGPVGWVRKGSAWVPLYL